MTGLQLVLIGGGHAHAIVVEQLRKRPLAGVRVTLISDTTHAPYSGMLPGHVAGFYDFETCHIPLEPLCQKAGVEFYCDRAIGLDLENQRVLCEQRPPVAFDWLSIDVGSTPAKTVRSWGSGKCDRGTNPSRNFSPPGTNF
uniref:FAD-dependent oxidoreductase n=1 Tax=Desertifilum tharense IPPAS B-1220 TaxID=1781255 RepID=A0ACD5H311_9CYAN